MSEHKFEIGDRVFILLRDRDREEDSRFHGVSRSSLGVVVQVRDLENTPFIYKVEISGDVFNHLHEKQMILVSDFDSFRERQFMHHNNAEWEPEELYRYSMIVKNYGDDRVVFANCRTERSHSSLIALVARGMKPVSLLEVENIPSENIAYVLRRIANRQNFNRHGWQEKCPHCSVWVGDDDSGNIDGEGYFCFDCYDNYIYKCSLCQKDFNVKDRSMKLLKGEKICGHCFDTRVYTCTACNLSYADKKYFEYDSYRYCGPCFDSRAISIMASPPRMISRSFINKISLGSGKEYFSNRSKTAVAVEIEAISIDGNEFDDEDSLREYDYPSGWKDTYDASIDDESGREFIMEPEFGDDALKKISIFCDWLRSEEFFVDNSCGLHVHTDAYYLGIEQLKGILLVTRALEPFIYKMIPMRRSESRYSKPMDEINPEIILEVKNARDFCDLWYETMNNTQATTEKYNDSRYRGLNLHSRFLHGTIEYRYHHGTISDYYINNWVLFCLAISDYGKNFLSLEKKSVLNLFINKESKDFSDYLTAMGVSNLIPYVNEMIESNSPGDGATVKETIWEQRV
jgi:hypothetical protein